MGGYDTVGSSGGIGDASATWQDGHLIAERFRILRCVGQGGMGKVYLARDETLGREVALKRIPQEIIFDGDARDDLRQEANRLLDLAHENIIRVHTYYDGPTWPFFAMEYLHGPTLKGLLHARKHEGRRFSPEEILAVARQVGCGLSHAHAKGIIHRDLKPGNLMLAAQPAGEIGDQDLVKITDFGVSRVVADSTLRQTGKRSGTIPYMSPEQFRGDPCTPQSDVYSFACSLYELASGKPPFHTGDIGYQILNVPPRPLSELPGPVGRAILRGLAKDPRRRFASAAELVAAMEGNAASPVSRLARGALGSVPRPVAFAGVIVLAALLIAGAGFLGSRDPLGSSPLGGGHESASSRLSAGRDGSAARSGEDIERFEEVLRAELKKQIPSLVGRRTAPGDIVRGDTLSLRFVFPEPVSSSAHRNYLEGLLLEYYATDPGSRQRVEGAMADGKKVFDLASLREGSYTLRAYLERGAARSFELLKEHPHKFRVDLTPPVFQVEVKNPQAFIEVQPPFRTTFDEWIDLQLDCPAADIAEARWQIVFGEQTLPYRPIEDVTRWQIDLPFGKSTYRVYAKDAAHNQTAATELTFRRLKLSCESFELAAPEAGGAPVTGNLARVKGVLLVEGEESPALRYFAISGKDETPIEPEAAGSSLDWEDYPRHGGVPFAAHLRLPYETNTIEIRYAWKENRPQPFARPMRIHDVRVQAPRIELAPVPERTASTRILLQGRIDPYFEGLEVLLQNVGQGTFWLTLAREPGGTASFAQHADLIPNQPNIIRIECRYRDKQLASPPVPVSVFCDRTPPEVTARCEIQGEGLTVRLYPSEVLKELRIQELGGMGELGDWRILEPEGLSSLYRHLVMPVPSRPVGFRVEMTDLAGNREFRDVYCQGESLAPSVASVASTENSSTRSGSAAEPRPAIESSSPRSSPGTENATKPAPPEYRSIDIQSAFLKDMGLDFVPFGHQRLEMARTELPEKVWYRFLAEKGHAPAKTGLADYPMTLADTAPELLREFVGWFQERARDGFDYEIPSREHWIAAFTGMSDTEAARRALVEWFQKSFQEPNERYGVNRPSAIGSRRVNATPTGLLDMESNVQEIVLEGEKFAVIGGSNRDTGAWQIQEHCLQARAYGTEERDLRGRVTGFRLCRRPARAR